jgi:hypothetical protein
MMVPAHDIDRVDSAHKWFVAHIERLDEDELRRDSLLPTWTIGHVLAHVARNADSHVRRTQAAITRRRSISTPASPTDGQPKSMRRPDSRRHN